MEKTFTLVPSLEGIQVLLYNDKAINVIVRNQQHQSRTPKQYKITIKEIK